MCAAGARAVSFFFVSLYPPQHRALGSALVSENMPFVRPSFSFSLPVSRSLSLSRVPSHRSQNTLILNVQAFTKLGFGFEEKCWCYETVAAVLHLGNISFSANGEGSQVPAHPAHPAPGGCRYAVFFF